MTGSLFKGNFWVSLRGGPARPGPAEGSSARALLPGPARRLCARGELGGAQLLPTLRPQVPPGSGPQIPPGGPGSACSEDGQSRGLLRVGPRPCSSLMKAEMQREERPARDLRQSGG